MPQKPKPIRSKNTKEARLKRIDVNLKVHYIHDQIKKRIDQLTQTIIGLSSSDKQNEHMIAVHRRNELEELDRWVKEEIIDKRTLGTREPMKIWDILKYGEDGEVYQATSTIESWNGAQVQIVRPESTNNLHLVYYKTPAIGNSSIHVGAIVNLVGAVTGAEWEFIGKHEPASLPSRQRLLLVCIDLKRILADIVGSDLVKNPLYIEKTKLRVEESIEYILRKMDEKPEDFVVDSNNTVQTMELKVLWQELSLMKEFITYLSDDEFAERAESLYSLIYYFYKTWWGISGWEYRIKFVLSEDEMITLAKDVLKSYKVNDIGGCVLNEI